MPRGVLDRNDERPFTMSTGQGEFKPICYTADPNIVKSLITYVINNILTLWDLYGHASPLQGHQHDDQLLLQPFAASLIYLRSPLPR